MSADLTYPGLRCILEYLEPNKRLHIASRSPILREFDKSIPVHIDHLNFDSNRFRIDNFIYEVYTEHENSDQNDPRYNNLWHQEYETVKFENLKTGFKNFKRVPNGITLSLKHLATGLLGYKTIYVNNLEFESNCCTVLRLPEYSKVNTRGLSTKSRQFSALLPLLDPSCFPLKELHFAVRNVNILKHPLVKNAEVVSIFESRNQNPTQILSNLQNKHVQLLEKFSTNEVMDIIRHWNNLMKPVGHTLKIAPEDDVEKLLELAKNRFGGKFKILEEHSKDRGENEKPPKLCVTVPMSSTTELTIYESDGTIKLENMAIGTAKPLSLRTSARKFCQKVSTDHVELLTCVGVIVILSTLTCAFFIHRK